MTQNREGTVMDIKITFQNDLPKLETLSANQKVKISADEKA